MRYTEDDCCDCHDAAREETNRLTVVIKGVHGALTDAGSVVVPGTLEGDLAPAIRQLTRERDEARAEATRLEGLILGCYRLPSSKWIEAIKAEARAQCEEGA
jgi:ssDNA-binding Zn-finger/Zn-ribbon topoisomerase 1